MLCAFGDPSLPVPPLSGEVLLGVLGLEDLKPNLCGVPCEEPDSRFPLTKFDLTSIRGSGDCSVVSSISSSPVPTSDVSSGVFETKGGILFTSRSPGYVYFCS